MQVTWKFIPFNSLSVQELYDLLALRTAVFVVEQNCAYLELDGKDKLAIHVLGFDSNQELIATARILPQGISYSEVSIGRVTLAQEARGIGLGHELMKEIMNNIHFMYGTVPIRISAQKHLESFYATHQFVSTGKNYLEDDIPHVEMLYSIEV
jgi:ElaA protein